MKAKVKLRKLATEQAEKAEANETKPAADKTSGPDAYGKRWEAGESIQALAKEAGKNWPALQRELRAAGYFRPPVRKAS
jgi:hypothetical protein